MNSFILKNLITLILILNISNKEVNPLFSSHIITSTIDQIIVCKKNNVTLMKTIEKELFISENNGFNWENISSSLIKSGKKVVDKKGEIGSVDRIVQNENNDNHLFFIGSDNISWVSIDCGLSIEAYNYGEKISEVFYHPLDANLILVTASSISKSKINSENTYDLFISKNAGFTWEYILGKVKEVSWGCRNKKQLEKGISKYRIIAAIISESDSVSNNTQMDLVYSDDLFINKSIPLSNIKHIFVNDYSIYVSRVMTNNDKQEKRIDVIQSYKDSLLLYYSTLDTYSLNFKSVIINTLPNTANLDVNFYSLNEKNEEVVLSLKQHIIGSKSTITNLYISKYGNEVFNASVENVIKRQDPSFIELNGLEGVYLANRMIIDEIESVISFNSGVSWNLIPKPTNIMNFIFQDKGYEEKVRRLCKHDECNLNLTDIRKMDNMNIGTLISNGFISIANHALERKDNLFISVDGGQTWKIIFEGETNYQISNSIILISSKHLKDQIYYSLDSGDNFSKLEIGVVDFYLESIVVFNQSRFVLIGINNSKNGVIVGIDFRNILEICEDQHLEKWVPYKNLGICINGENIEFIRKNPYAKCLDNYGTKFALSKTCLCSESDYYCDFGYKRQFNYGPCIKNFDYKQNTEKCVVYNTKGYILIPGNKCMNGVELNPVYSKIKNCDMTELPLMLIASIIIIVLIFIITFYISKFIEKNNRFSKNYKNTTMMESVNNDLNRSIEMSRKKSESTFGSRYELEEDSE